MPSVDGLLRDLNARLDVSPRRRPDILREVRGDIEALVARLVAEGVPEAQAEARAVALLHPGAEAAAALGEVHRSLSGRLTRRLGDRVVRGAEHLATVAMAGLALWAPVAALREPLRLVPWATVPLLALGALLVANPTRVAIGWWLRAECDARALAASARLQGVGVGLAVLWAALVTVGQGYGATAVWAVVPPTVGEVADWVAWALALHALALGVAILGVFGALALAHALWTAKGLEVELGELLSDSRTSERSC